MTRPPVDIERLTQEERLRLLDDLWDSLCPSPSVPPLSDSQRVELDRRLDDLAREGPIGIPWDELVRRVTCAGG